MTYPKDMVTIGDVLGIVAILCGLGVTAWALMVSCGLLFPQKVEFARQTAQNSPWENLLKGILVLIPGIIGVIMLGAAGPGKLLGSILVLAVLSIGAIGTAGLGHLAGRSMHRMSEGMPEYPAFVRGCAFLVTASMLPILGWLVFAPVVLLIGLGSGARAIMAHTNTELARERS
jgi:hypothetical protein